jgi:hypothetical protein
MINIKIKETAKSARSALRKAFPGSKISVTSHSSAPRCLYNIRVHWADTLRKTGPTVKQVEKVLRRNGLKAVYWLDRHGI